MQLGDAMPHHPITPPDQVTIAAPFDAVMATLKDDREMQRDRATSVRACCSPRAPEQLRRAPVLGIDVYARKRAFA